MRDVLVIGVGMTKFGKFPEIDVARELGREACIRAIKDSGIDRKLIRVAYCGEGRGKGMVGQRILREIGMTGIPVTNVENACSSGSSALRQAYLAVASGYYDVALAMGVEQLSFAAPKGVIPTRQVDVEGPLGMTMPASFAMVARRHMKEYGTTIDQLAKISVKNHRNGCLNPYAQYHDDLTLEEVKNSRMISDPLTLLQCCPTGDGAAAAVLCSKDIARRSSSRPIRVAASVLTSGTYESGFRDLTENDQTIRASLEAYEISGYGPKDLDVIELHDCFTIAELYHYENLGLCARGEGGRMIDEGETQIGGKIPVNPSGGLLAKGHPLGATGIAQVTELVWQLRGEAGSRQVADPHVALAHCLGGVVDNLDLGSCTVHILVKDY